jgi:segregation and condensation protein A
LEPECSFQLVLPGFEGTISGLVELVEQERIDIEGLPLENITEQFSRYLGTMQGVDLEVTGEFLRSAVRLMLLKSQLLLPRTELELEEEEYVRDEGGLRLVMGGIRPATEILRAREGIESFPGLPAPHQIEREMEPQAPSALTRAWQSMLKRKGQDIMQMAAPAFLKLEVALSELIRGLKSARRISLGKVLRDANRYDAVIHFLAALELIRQRQAVGVQDGLFGDIELESTEPDGAVGSRAG